MDFALVIAIGALFCGLIALVVVQEVRQRRRDRAAASALFRQFVIVYCGPHEYREVTPDDPAYPSAAGYQAVRDACLAAGLRELGCFDDLTVRRAFPEQAQAVVAYVHSGGHWAVGTFEATGHQITEAVAATADGRYLLTTNAPVGLLEWPPEVSRRQLRGRGSAEVIAAHRERVEELLRQSPPPELVGTSTLRDAIALAQRYSGRLADFRQSIGFLTLAEALAFTDRIDQERGARRIWAHFASLVAERSRHGA